MRSMAFVLPIALPSLNKTISQHWSRRGKQREYLLLEVIGAIGGTRHLPRPPFAKARISICRHSSGTLDSDNLAGAHKGLVDLLCVRSRVHPLGLGIIEDDAPSKCELVLTQQKASRGEAFTAVRVEELA